MNKKSPSKPRAVNTKADPVDPRDAAYVLNSWLAIALAGCVNEAVEKATRKKNPDMRLLRIITRYASATRSLIPPLDYEPTPQVSCDIPGLDDAADPTPDTEPPRCQEKA